MATALGPAWAGGLVTQPVVGSRARPHAITGTRKAAAPRLAGALPRFAERALRSLPVVGPVSPTQLKLPLWAMLMIALGLVWLAALVGHVSVGRR